MNEPRPLHRIFGLSWIDFFQGTSVEVETELDLSLKQQFIDVVLIRKDSKEILRRLPDGFEELAAHNLLTFKSHHEPLDAWTLCELIGHFVNYRKQSSPSMQELLPQSDYRLFAVCARFPEGLSQLGVLIPIREGVFEVQVLTLRIRIVVVNRLPQEEHNARLLLFSAQERLLNYGKAHFRPNSPETSTLLLLLFEVYNEDRDMSDKLKEFVRETMEEIFRRMPVEERLKGLSAKERLEGLSTQERLEGLPPEEAVRALEELIHQLKPNGSSKAD